MKKESGLLDHLKVYSESDMYPFHMPGHKRRTDAFYANAFPNPFSVDITEIDGFDNLHHPEGILKQSMEWAAKVYGADKTYYLVNGSSSGVLSAVCGTTNGGSTILISRNCHKSAYDGVFLNCLHVEYIYPQILGEYGVQGGLLPEEIGQVLKTHREIKAVLVVSPTYDGIVSDIRVIAEICHCYGIPLIVDEAHGAHFRYGKGFPAPALELGADVVIQSLHKTLPSFTQTALLHVKEGYVNVDNIERYLHIFQSSSPSYLFMAGIENCIRYMEEPGPDGELSGRQCADVLAECLERFREDLKRLHHIRIMGREVVGRCGVFDLDCSKIIISVMGAGISGSELMQILRERYHLEMEMCTESYVTAITTVMDTEEGLNRLKDALIEIDGELDREWDEELRENTGGIEQTLPQAPRQAAAKQAFSIRPERRMTIHEAVEAGKRCVPLAESQGNISGEYVYLYPPGIPFVTPGEVLSKDLIDMIVRYRELGLSVQGMKDQSLKMIDIVEGQSMEMQRMEPSGLKFENVEEQKQWER